MRETAYLYIIKPIPSHYMGFCHCYKSFWIFPDLVKAPAVSEGPVSYSILLASYCFWNLFLVCTDIPIAQALENNSVFLQTFFVLLKVVIIFPDFEWVMLSFKVCDNYIFYSKTLLVFLSVLNIFAWFLASQTKLLKLLKIIPYD